MPAAIAGMTREGPVPATNRQILLVETPRGKLGPEHFKLQESPMPSPKDGELLLKVRYISLDAANRAWMQGATYREAVRGGDVMAGGAVAEVIESKSPGFAAGDLVFGDTGWQEFAAMPAKRFLKVPNVQPMTHLLSVYGVAGLTAYFGLLDVGKPKQGETVVVSAAAGSVGSIVGQIAKIKGCRAVGIAGGPDKCRFVTDELGFDACIDYRAGNLAAQLDAACPKGIDVNFENVGGDILDAILPRMNTFGRVAICGLISGYNAASSQDGPKNFRAILTQRLKVQGLIVSDWAGRIPEAITALSGWHKEGKLKIREDVRDGGIEAFVDTLNLLYTGGNNGKLVLKV
jgi:NADPH-dependent curcumin reductase CurA